MLAGAFSVGAIISFGKSLMNTADGMKNMAEATNSTMGAMVALKTIGAENNLNWDEMSKILGKVRDAQGAVVNLSKTESDALARLNINAEEFVGAGVDKALELMAQGYVKANGSAESLNALNDIFGKKIGPKAVEMMKAMAAEGLDSLTERTKAATEGFEQLAGAQSTLEKFFSSIEIGAAKAINSVSKFGEEMGKLSVEKPKQGFLSSAFEAMGNVFYAGKFDQDLLGDKVTNATRAKHGLANKGAAGASDSAAQSKMRANQAEVARKKSEDENKKAQELGRQYYFRELKNQRDIEQVQRETENKIADLNKPGAVKGVGATVDSIMRIGGQIGMSRPGLATEDRAMRIQQETKKVMEDMRDKLQILIDKQDEDRDWDEG